MPVSHDTVRAWLQAYIEAWKSHDPEQIGALFSQDATYYFRPWDDPPMRGREAIVAQWMEWTDVPGSFEAHYEPVAVDGNIAVATGYTFYRANARRPNREYRNCFVLRFDDAGQCAHYMEWFVQTPDDIAAPRVDAWAGSQA